MTDRRRVPNRLVLLAQVAVIVAAIALLALRFIVIDAGSHSASDTLRPWLVEAAIVAAATLAVAVIGRLAVAAR